MAEGGSERRGKRTFWGGLAYWTVVLGVWGLIGLAAFLIFFIPGLPDTSKLYEVDRQPSIAYLDRNGGLIAVRGSQEAPPADLKELPEYVPAAFVAIEDQQFYRHLGFNPVRMTQAFIANRKAGRITGGGSTITQQLAKNLFLSPEQTYRRKMQELLLAIWLETKFSKDEILSLYLNRVSFGGGAYGIEAASQRYFNKDARELSLGEAALLAGLLKGPSRYSPVSNTERAERRANIVLSEMVEQKVITPEERARAFAQPVRVSKRLANQHANYFIDWVDGEVRALVGDTDEDLIVQTTLDLPIQAAAESAVRTITTRDAAKGVQQAALVAIDGDGRVRAMIGGKDYAESQYNRAVEAKRQAGSAFKPFVYLTAMEQGRTPDLGVVDEPIRIGNWEPKNYTNSYMGAVTLETAVAQSLNTVAARVADEVGRDNVARTARRLGIKSKIQLEPSMALGAVEVSPLEMAQAYVPFSNGGMFANPYGIERIRSRSGQVLYEHKLQPVEQRSLVVNNPALSHMNRMMRAVVRGGTGTRAQVPGYDIAGKTGTTSDYKDAWFVGFTGGFTTAVWVGKDNNKPMKKVTGGGAPAEIWRSFMTSALPRLAVRPIPEGPAALPNPIDDPIGDLLHTANDFFEDPAVLEDAAVGPAPEPLPLEPQPYQPEPYVPPPPPGRTYQARPYQPPPAEAPPYRAPSGPRPGETPSLEDYVAAGRPG
ncbi:MAG TPA: penicillin-binding protein 1A [Caulobacteraceae bacterium]|jgi:penicillin-binding protein 1A